MFGDPETTPHGKALPYYSSVRIKLSGTKKMYEKAGSDRVIGTMCNAKVFKNKVAPNWRSVSFPLMYDYGINDAQSILDYLSDLKIVKTGGAWKTLTVGENDYKFQSPNWREIYNKPDVQKYIKEVLDENMIIKFEGMPDSFNIDAESFMEIDQLKTDVEEKQ
jgi:recombination protein RecA